MHSFINEAFWSGRWNQNQNQNQNQKGCLQSKQKGKRHRDREVEDEKGLLPAMLPRHVPRVCRMSWSSRTAAAASSPQLISGSITSSIRPTPTNKHTHSDQNTLSRWVGHCISLHITKKVHTHPQRHIFS